MLRREDPATARTTQTEQGMSLLSISVHPARKCFVASVGKGVFALKEVHRFKHEPAVFSARLHRRHREPHLVGTTGSSTTRSSKGCAHTVGRSATRLTRLVSIRGALMALS